MTEIVITLPSSDLASRRTAAVERHKIISQIQQGNQVSVDLINVESLSYSYADELFGVTVANKGLDWLVNNISIINARESVLRVVAEVVKLRLNETGQTFRRSA